MSERAANAHDRTTAPIAHPKAIPPFPQRLLTPNHGPRVLWRYKPC